MINFIGLRKLCLFLQYKILCAMEKSKYINLFTDLGFKKILGEESNKDLLLNFLNELLRPQGVIINKLTYKEDTKLPKSAEDRKVIFDLFCENENGDKFTIQLQKAKQDQFLDRLLYFSTFSIQEQGNRGKLDYRLNAVYIVAILDFFFEQTVTKKLASYYKMFDLDTHEAFSDKLNFVTVEMPHFNKEEHELKSNLDKWLYLLNKLHYINSKQHRITMHIYEKIFKIYVQSDEKTLKSKKYKNSIKNHNDTYQALKFAYNDAYERARKRVKYQNENFIEKPLPSNHTEDANTLQKASKALALAEKEKAEKEKALIQAEKERAEKEKEKAEKEQALSWLSQIAKKLLAKGFSKEETAETIDIPLHELDNLLS
jgi:predicted transposase/invertase (TIGR01784 family)